MTCPTTDSTSTLAQIDLAEWCRALQGAAELLGSSSSGSVIGGRGCVEQLTNPNEYMVTVAWQGMVPLVEPASSVGCGATLYRTSSGGVCDASDLCRRTVTSIVRIDPLI
jgi:type IV pilus assembly protein PilV